MKFLVITRRRPHATLEVVLPKDKDELLEVHTMNASGFAFDTYIREEKLGAVLLIEAPDLKTVHSVLTHYVMQLKAGWIQRLFHLKTLITRLFLNPKLLEGKLTTQTFSDTEMLWQRLAY